MKFRLLDVCCGAGGCSEGYARAGFDVTGCDLVPQKRYPFKFIQADCLDVIRDIFMDFEVIHASFPCQKFSTMTKRWGREDYHPDLITPGRKLLKASGKPYVIENVPGAPLDNPITLCGSMFKGLRVRRHRLFESNVPLVAPKCDHAAQGPIVGVYGHAGGSSKRDGLTFHGTAAWKDAMGIDWMTGKELAEAIPPAYTEFVGKQLLAFLESPRRALQP